MAKRPKISVTVRLTDPTMAALKAWVASAQMSISEAIEVAVSEALKRRRLHKPTHKPRDGH